MLHGDIPRSISVVIPARDAAAYIEQQLAALAAQRCPVPWEVVVADNGSRDGTRELVARWEKRFTRLVLVNAATVPTSGHARNVGAAAARGDALLFCDADDVVGERWLAAHVEALRDDVLVTGPIDARRLNAAGASGAGPPARWRSAPPIGNAFLPYALGANLAIRRTVFDDVGGFDARRNHGNDKVLSWSVQLAGHRLGFAEDAVVHYRLRPDTGGTWRRQLRIARAAPSLYERFRRHGMPRSSLRQAVREWAWLLLAPPTLWSPQRRLRYARTAGRRLGRLLGSVRERTCYL